MGGTMFGKLIEFWKTRKAVKEIHEHPIYSSALANLRNVFNDKSSGLGKYWSEEGKARITTRILTDIQQTFIGRYF
jgi:hypothetical protein